jgi:carboxyl-terminal processing protease
MNMLSNVAKLSLAILLAAVLISVAFLVGYQAGHEVNGGSGVAEIGGITLQQRTEPTPTPPDPTETAVQSQNPSPTPSPAVEAPSATDTPAPSAEELIPNLTDEEALKVLGEVWDLLEQEFYGELPPSEERVYGAIRGMLDTLDDDATSFSEPSIAEIRRTDDSGSFEGIGAHVTMNENDILEIVQPFEGSPAERAGLKSGDLVLAVDGESIVGYGIYDAITLIRGPEGSEVELTIQRGEDGETFTVSIVRARLDIPTVESRMLDNNIGYVSLFEFSAKATERLEDAIQDLFDQGADALVLDLRGNPGGFLLQANQVADLFLDSGLILIERRSDGQEIEYSSTEEGIAQDVPLVVLVNGHSASASEIVAGAVQDRGRGVLIGETTFGKGSVQLLHTLSDGSELRVTVARWFTPDDRAIHGDGLEPDIVVPFTEEDMAEDRDPQLDRAIEYLTTGQ